MSDRLDAMRALIAVIETGGFTPAARGLGVPPAAVTRMVAALERDLEVQLLHRTTRSVRPTRAGEAYLSYARAALSEVAAAERAAREEAGALSGKVRLAMPLLFGRLHGGRLVAELMRRYPDVRVEVALGNERAKLVEGGFDLAIRIGELPDSGLITRSIGSTHVVLVASPLHLVRVGAPCHPDDLRKHSLITFAGVADRRYWRFSLDGVTSTVAVDPTFSSDNGEIAIDLAVRGGGILSALRYQVSPSLRDGSLIEILACFRPAPVPIQAVLPGTRHIAPATRLMLDLLVEQQRWWTT